MRAALEKARSFADALGICVPVLLAPMAGACPAALSIAVANGGGMGACGAVLMRPDEITQWVAEMRRGSNGAFQLNTWVPDPEPVRDHDQEAKVRAFLRRWGPEVADGVGDAPPHDFEGQCEAMLAAGPAVISSIMGLYPPEFVTRVRAGNIKWFATATTVAEAVEAERAGADAVIAQGMEAGGHRGTFSAAQAEVDMVGLYSLVPAVRDAVDVPVIAAGGIADARGVAAALVLGASAVQIGTAFLRAPEAGVAPSWADGIAAAAPEATVTTRAFSGRLGRSLRTRYALAASAPDAPAPAPYPVQRNLTLPMRAEAKRSGSLDGMQAWAGQSARLAPSAPAAETVAALWSGAETILA